MAAPRAKAEKSRLELPEIKKLIELIERSPITDFELNDKDLKIRISKNGGGAPAMHMVPMATPAMPAPMPQPAPQAAAPAFAPAAPEPKARQLTDIKSPMVGTFYRAPAPDAEPYIRIGDLVEPGKVLCIVEAMKLMNELECEIRGRVVEILIENAQPVEFGQALFRVDTSVA